MHGYSSSVAPRLVKLRMIERLMPVSSAMIRGPDVPSSASNTMGSRVVTSRARSRPTMLGSAWTRSIASPWLISAGKIPPRIAPASRMWRTSERVSTPLMPGTPLAASQSSQPCSAPGASLGLTASRMIAPAAWIRSDSIPASPTP